MPTPKKGKSEPSKDVGSISEQVGSTVGTKVVTGKRGIRSGKSSNQNPSNKTGEKTVHTSAKRKKPVSKTGIKTSKLKEKKTTKGKKTGSSGVNAASKKKPTKSQVKKRKVATRDKKTSHHQKKKVTKSAGSDLKFGLLSEGFIGESQGNRDSVRKNAANALIEKLESDLVMVEQDLEKSQRDAEKTQTKLILQLNELKSENESLIAEISAFKQVKSKADETAVQESDLDVQIKKLESELVAAQDSLENFRQEEEEAKSKLNIQLKELKTNNELLIAEISSYKRAKSEAEQAAVRESEQKARVNELRSELAAAQDSLEKSRQEEEGAQSKLILQLNELKAENESLIAEISAFEQAKNKADEIAIREDEQKARVTALESELSLAQHQKEELNVQSQSSSDISEINLEEPEEEVALSDWIEEEVKEASTVEEVEIGSTDEKAESMMEPAASQSFGVLTKVKEETSQPEFKADEPVHPAVTDTQVKKPAFSSSIDNVIFSRILSDIDSEDVKTRANAVKVIGGIPHELSAKTLVDHLSNETSPQVRQECIKALTRQEVNGGLQPVRRALADPAASVRLAAVRSLYRLAGEKSASDLVRMLSDESEEVCRRAATCIGWLGREDLAVELIPLLSNGNPSVRKAAIEAMGSLRSRKVISALIEHLDEPEKSVRRAIINALEKITGKKMSGPLPRNQKALQCYIARWHEWWKEELLGQ